MFKNLILVLLLLPATLLAQNIISGKVISLTGKKGVPDASVFLSNASVGSKTLDDGTFTLNNVKNGQYDLVVSCIGFEAHHQAVLVNNNVVTLPDIELSPKTTVLKEVKVTFDQDRERHVKMFLEEFFGRLENASQCKLLNPDMLDITFQKSTGILTASTSDFLLIENKALGYKIKYLLQDFTKDPRRSFVSYSGASIYEPMTGSTSDQKRWQKNRIKAYRGSYMHFLRACIGQQVTDEGFVVRQLIRKPNADRPADSIIKLKLIQFRPAPGVSFDNNDSLRYWSEKSRLPENIQTLINTPLNARNYIKLTEKKGTYAFGDKACLMIDYTKSNHHSTVITFSQQYAFFDVNGIVLNPHSQLLEGYMAYLRIADQLPADYELPANF